MRTALRTIISLVAGFALMWPLGFTYGLLGWPTFHSWGLLHGGFFSAWPTLSLVTFLALGYVKQFIRVEDTPLLLAATLWGLVLTGFLGVTDSFDASALFYGLLIATAVIVSVLSFFAKRKIRIPLFVILPVVFLQSQFLVFASGRHVVTFSVEEAPYTIGLPLLSALAGCALGSIARGLVRA
jgi:hypothetical protein